MPAAGHGEAARRLAIGGRLFRRRSMGRVDAIAAEHGRGPCSFHGRNPADEGQGERRRNGRSGSTSPPPTGWSLITAGTTSSSPISPPACPGPSIISCSTPINLMFEEVTASSLVKVDMSGNPVEPTPFITNAAGFTIHSALHMAREDAQAVIHLHTPERPGGLRPWRGPAAADPDRDADPRRGRLSRL